MSKKQERIETLMQLFHVMREKLTDKLPPDPILQVALDGMLNSRTGRKLAKAKPFREHPLGSLLHRMISWHGSNGSLWSLYGAREDARLLTVFDETFGPYWTNPKSRMSEHKELVGDLDGVQLHDQLETAAMVMCGGSNAAQAWAKALGYE